MDRVALNRIVKSYDVRGLVDSELTPELVRALGAAFVDVVAGEGNTLVVGHDMRESSPVLSASFIEGATRRGADVRSIGLCSTDMAYFASGTWDMPSVMFTASHNPASYNGIKFSRRLAQGISLDSGLADIRDRAGEYVDLGDIPAASRAGSVTIHDVLVDYTSYLHSLVDLKNITPLKVVVDAANGMAGHTVPGVLGGEGDSTLPLTVIPLYFELDGSFPNHEANPLEPSNLVDLQKAVVAHGADLGLAFDGDADRCFVIDERGNPVSPSIVAAMVAQREIRRVKSAGESAVTVIHNLICSRTVKEVIEENGATALRSRVGHSYIKDDMKTSGAVFGGEHSAHYYFRDFWGADNGMLAALHVLAERGSSTTPLSELVKHFSRYVESGEINSVVVDQARAMDDVTRSFEDRAHIDKLDGITVTGKNTDGLWWFNVRPSNTEPLLRLNVEAKTQESMESIRDEVLAIIRSRSES